MARMQALALATLCQKGTQLPLPERGTALQFSAHTFAAKWLNGLRCHLIWSQASAQVTLCQMVTPPAQKGGRAPTNFWPMSIVAKRLDGSRWHLPWRWASVHATLCQMGTQLPSPKRGQSPPIFGPFMLWRNGWMHQDTTWYGGRPRRVAQWSTSHCLHSTCVVSFFDQHFRQFLLGNIFSNNLFAPCFLFFWQRFDQVLIFSANSHH